MEKYNLVWQVSTLLQHLDDDGRLHLLCFWKNVPTVFCYYVSPHPLTGSNTMWKKVHNPLRPSLSYCIFSQIETLSQRELFKSPRRSCLASFSSQEKRFRNHHSVSQSFCLTAFFWQNFSCLESLFKNGWSCSSLGKQKLMYWLFDATLAFGLPDRAWMRLIQL